MNKIKLATLAVVSGGAFFLAESAYSAENVQYYKSDKTACVKKNKKGEWETVGASNDCVTTKDESTCVDNTCPSGTTEDNQW